MLRIFTFGLLTGLALDLCYTQQIPKTDFSCEGRASGYYADVSSGCQFYHMCDGLGRQFSYTCPNATLFQQRMLICDHWYMVNCSRSEDDYSANLLIGQQKPFVEDSGSHPYYRTPRPDLLSHPSSESEYNIIYRTGKNQKTSKNIVGIEPDTQQSTYADDEPTYFPPSHWSTEYPSRVTTPKPIRGAFNNRRTSIQNAQTNYRFGTNHQNSDNTNRRTFNQGYNTNTNTPSRNANQNLHNGDYARRREPNFNRNSPSRTIIENYNNVNYNTRGSTQYNANTDFSTRNPSVNDDRRKSNQNFEDFNISAKKSAGDTVKVKQQKAINFSSSNRNGNIVPDSPKYKINDFDFNTPTTKVPVNYKSNFKATTPVFPLVVDDKKDSLDSLIPPPNPKINFPAPFTLAEDTSSAPTEVPINYKSKFKATTPVFPLNVDEASEAPNEIGILPPIPHTESDNTLSETSFKSPNHKTKVEEKSELPEVNVTSQVNSTSGFNDTTTIYPTFEKDSTSTENLEGKDQVNFKSEFKATTPVFPTFNELKNLNIPNNNPSEVSQVNFQSNFSATTPVYPSFEELKKLNVDVDTDYSNILSSPPLKEKGPAVNFVSDFKATTPVYPTSVNPTSPDPGEAGLLPPPAKNITNVQGNSTLEKESKSDQVVPTLALSVEPPEFNEKYRNDPEHLQTTVAPPSMFYQPPKLETYYTPTEKKVSAMPGVEIENIMKSLTSQQWKNLRQRLQIPEYDFPLEDATRPSYDSVLNSFAVKSTERKR